MAAPRRGELAGVPAGRRRCSAVWERGEGKRARGMGLWGSLIARARVRRGRRALPAAVHGGVAVAAGAGASGRGSARGTAGGGTARWQGRWRGSGATRGRQCEAKRGRAGSPRRRRHCTAAAAEKNRGKLLEVEEKGCFAISKNSRDQNVKQG